MGLACSGLPSPNLVSLYTSPLRWVPPDEDDTLLPPTGRGKPRPYQELARSAGGAAPTMSASVEHSSSALADTSWFLAREQRRPIRAHPGQMAVSIVTIAELRLGVLVTGDAGSRA